MRDRKDVTNMNSIHCRVRTTTLIALGIFAGIAPLALAKSSATAVSRPFSGACQTRFQFLSPPNTFPLQLHIDSQCNITHLGLTTGSTSQTVFPAGPPVGQSLPILI